MISDILNIKLDSIADVTQEHQAPQRRINPDNHFIIEADGKVLEVTEDKERALAVYRMSQAPNKRVLRVWNGKQFQFMPRGFC